MNLKKLVSFMLATTLALSTFTGCSSTTTSTSDGDTTVKVNKNDPYFKNSEAGIFRIAGGYEPPEVAHANVWVPGSAGTILGNTADFIHEKLFDYIPLPEKTYLPVLGESFTQEDNVITINLRQGVTWNDGTPFTSKDVIATFNLGFIHNWVVWDHLASIEATDDYTVVATLKQPNAITTQLVTNVVINSPYHLYKEWADQAATIVANRKSGTDTKYDKATSDAMIALRDDLHQFKPDVTTVVGTGPFKIHKLTTAEGVLTKNEKYWNPDNIKINEVRIMRTSSLEAQMNLIMSKGYDWENLGLSPDVHAQVVKDNPEMRVMLGADLGQPSLQFNQRIAPMDNKLVRQAIQHLVDRESLLLIAEPGSEIPDLTSSGMIPAMRDQFLSKEFQDTLTVYNNDDQKAEELLKQAGWSKNSNGIWVDEKGEVVQLEFVTTSTYPTYFLCADSIVNQLNEFGITSQLKAMESSAYFKHLQEQGAMMSVSMRPGSPNYGEPWEIFRSFFLDGAADLGFTTLAEKKAGLTNVVIELEDGTKLDTGEILHEMLVTTDDTRKVELTEYFAKLINDQSYFMPLVTKYIPQKVYNPYLTGFSSNMSDPMWYGGGATRVAARLIREGKLYYATPDSK